MFEKLKITAESLQNVGQIKDMVGEFVKFSHDALLTIIKNQHAIHARLAQVEQKCAIVPQPTLLPGPEALIKLNGEAPPEGEHPTNG